MKKNAAVFAFLFATLACAGAQAATSVEDFFRLPRYAAMVTDGEGHGFHDPAKQKVFYEAVAKFLDNNIGH